MRVSKCVLALFRNGDRESIVFGEHFLWEGVTLPKNHLAVEIAKPWIDIVTYELA